MLKLLVAVCRQLPVSPLSGAKTMKMLPQKTLFPQQMTARAGPALPKTLFPQHMTVRRGHLIPKSQYDFPEHPTKFKFPAVLFTYWETIPLFTCTGFAMGLVVAAIIWAARNKVDVVFQTHSRRNISRTMDLRCPTAHKMVLIEQKYKPWPEMQQVLDKMKNEECNRILNATVAQ
ncbi:hypothetical protein O0L34_g4275 [Tuta absoluta]|nr:hypothetical protein O0L34_g4275 [Tuta absoluta]